MSTYVVPTRHRKERRETSIHLLTSHPPSVLGRLLLAIFSAAVAVLVCFILSLSPADDCRREELFSTHGEQSKPRGTDRKKAHGPIYDAVLPPCQKWKLMVHLSPCLPKKILSSPRSLWRWADETKQRVINGLLNFHPGQMKQQAKCYSPDRLILKASDSVSPQIFPLRLQ